MGVQVPTSTAQPPVVSRSLSPVNLSEIKRLSNRALVEQLVDAGSDDLLWREFVSRFQGRLRLNVARTYQLEAAKNPDLDTGPVEEAAEDLTQEVFVRLLASHRRALSRFRGRSEHSIVTYLAAIAVNLVRDHFRRLRAQKKPRASLSLTSGVPAADTDDPVPFESTLVCETDGPEGHVARKELLEQIREALSGSSKTSARDRLVFRLFFVEGLTVSEIARIGAVGLSESGVEKCIRRIREILKSRLSEGGAASEIASLR